MANIPVNPCESVPPPCFQLKSDTDYYADDEMMMTLMMVCMMLPVMMSFASTTLAMRGVTSL